MRRSRTVVSATLLAILLPLAPDFETDGAVDLPLNACGAFGLLSTVGQDLDQHGATLDLIAGLNDAFAGGNLDAATWEDLTDRAVHVLDLIADGSAWGGINLLDGNTFAVDVVLPHQSSPLQLPLYDMTAPTLGLDAIDAASFETFTRWTRAAVQRNQELQAEYEALAAIVGPICYDTLPG